MAGNGRPCKLTPELEARIVAAIERGATRDTAAQEVGVNERTVYRWMARGRKQAALAQFRQFRQAIKRAEAQAVLHFVGIIRDAAPKSWQAAAWWLERRYPLDWGRRESEELGRLEKKLRELEQRLSRTGSINGRIGAGEIR